MWCVHEAVTKRHSALSVKPQALTVLKGCVKSAPHHGVDAALLLWEKFCLGMVWDQLQTLKLCTLNVHISKQQTTRR